MKSLVLIVILITGWLLVPSIGEAINESVNGKAKEVRKVAR